ncbi:unnamed protein product [Trichogramma brassicae]|uniref:Copia protein n=1 Tax=Trichogramma brassicae TaxID=86971 RepID=A0A6H5J2U7_9HYME|nr:unnamed protein product [Trichogramma brassicae]
MADVSDLKNIPKFNGQNFQLWKFQIKTVLVAHDLLEIVEGTETKPEPGENNANATKVKEWTKKDAKAMFALSSSIDYSQLDYLVNCASANEMWKKLSNIHEQKSTSNKLALTTKFHEYRKSPNDSIAQHVAKIENIASQLKDIGQTVSDVMIMAKIISTLPSKYNAFISTWDSVPDTDQTMDKLRERLLREETRMSADDDIPRAFAATTIDAKNNGRKQPEQPAAPVNDCPEVPERDVEQPPSDDESFVDARDDHMPENFAENLVPDAESPAAIDDRAHHNLRPREGLRPPVRYEAHVSIYDEPRNYKEALSGLMPSCRGVRSMRSLKHLQKTICGLL